MCIRDRCIPKLRKDKTIPIFFLTCAIALTSFCGFTYTKYQPVTALDGMQCKVDAVITQVPGGPTYDRYYYIIETCLLYTSRLRQYQVSQITFLP